MIGQRYEANDRATGSFERAFSPQHLGSSTVSWLDSDVLLYRSFKEAKGEFRRQRLLYSSGDVATRCSERERAASARAEPGRDLAPGDDAYGTSIRATLGGRDVRLVAVVVRVGQVIGFITAMGPASALRFEDVQPLVATFAARIARGL